MSFIDCPIFFKIVWNGRGCRRWFWLGSHRQHIVILAFLDGDLCRGLWATNGLLQRWSGAFLRRWGWCGRGLASRSQNEFAAEGAACIESKEEGITTVSEFKTDVRTKDLCC